MCKLLINNKCINVISGFVRVLVNLENDNIDVDDNELLQFLKIEDSEVNSKDLLHILIKYRKNIKSLIKYIERNVTNLDLNRMISYIEFRKINSSDANSEKFYKLMYGDVIGGEKFKQQQNKFSKYYDKNYYIQMGLDEVNALKKIEEFKKNKATNITNFIKKYGEKEGTKKYDEYVDKSKNTIDNFKKRYGDEWENKWQKYLKKDSSSFDWALKKANGVVELAEEIFNEKKEKTTTTLNLLIKKYGDELGEKKWEESNKKKDGSSLVYFINKFKNSDLSLIKYLESNKKKDSSSLMFFNYRYGVDGIKKYEEKCKLSDSKSLNFFIKKYVNYDVAYYHYIEEQKKIKVKTLKASKESLKYFKPLYDFLLEKNIVSEKEIYLGIDGVNEFFILDDKKIYFYDFVIRSKKIIIEFNGKAWHPNWEKYEINEAIVKFKNTKINPINTINNDIVKLNLAKKHGYDLLTLWEEDGYDINNQKLKIFLNKKNIKYEN